jgi:peroxiredoxin
LYERFKEEGFEIIAVDGKRDTERAVKFIADNGLSYTLLENGEGEDEIAGEVYDVIYYPSSFLIDRNGKVMYYHLGFEAGDEEKLEEEIRSLL